MVKTCRRCGDDFQAKCKTNEYCSRKCFQEDKARDLYVCSYCGKVFIPKERTRTTYCSRDCYFAAKTKRKEERLKLESEAGYKVGAKCNIYFMWCTVCDELFISRSPLAGYCSNECRMVKHLKRIRAKYKGEWQEPEPFECKECGKMVEPEFRDLRRGYCSELCMKRNLSRNSYHRRRSRKVNGFVKSVSKLYICRRDKWRCHICGKKVNDKLKNPHLMSATLDHIVPLAIGGTHEPKNVKLAHMICNSMKGIGSSRGGDQLMMFG